jgi:hypothetical protein
VVENRGDGPLNIKQVKGSCGCVVAQDVPHVVSAGSSRVIKIEYTAQPGKKVYEQAVAIESDDPRTPVRTVRLAGNILENDGFSCSMQSIHLVRLLGDVKNPVAEVTLRNTDHELNLLEAGIASEALSTYVRKLDDHSVVVGVTGLPLALPVTEKAMLAVKVIMAGKSELIEVPITYELQPAIVAYPQAMPLPPEGVESYLFRVILKANDHRRVVVERAEMIGLFGLTTESRQRDDGSVSVLVKGNPKRDNGEKKPGLQIWITGESAPLFVPVE